MADRELHELPNISRLFAQAMVPRRRPDPSAAPTVSDWMVVPDHRQEVERLAAYARVVGLTLRDTVPATWLHVLTFPLQMAVMAAPEFPMQLTRVLHASNEMRLARPVGVGEALRLAVRRESIQPHRKGVTFDLVGSVMASGEEVWTGRSTYLAAGRVPGDPVQGLRLEAVSAEPVQLWTLGANLGRQYAAASGDHNPIHTSRLGARALGLRRPIIHGMWTHARALAALEGRLPEAYGVRVQFTKPIPLPGRVAFAVAEGHDEVGTRFVVSRHRDGAPHLVGEIMAG